MRGIIAFLVALALAVPAGAQQPGVVTSRPQVDPPYNSYLEPIRELSQKLQQQVNFLMQDISVEVGGSNRDTLLREADATYLAATRVRDAVKHSVTMNEINTLFTDLDARLLRLLEQVRAVAKSGDALPAMAERLSRTERQLYDAVARGHTLPERTLDTVRPGSTLLAAQAAEFRGLAEHSAPDSRLAEDAADFARALRNLDRTVQAGGNPRQLRGDLGRAEDVWHKVAADVNAMQLRPDSYLLTRAQQLERSYDQLRRQLGLGREQVRIKTSW